MLYYKNYSKLNLYNHKINRNTNVQLFIKKFFYYGGVREVAALYRSRGYNSKADILTRLSSRRSSAADRQSVKRDYVVCGRPINSELAKLRRAVTSAFTRVFHASSVILDRICPMLPIWWQQILCCLYNMRLHRNSMSTNCHGNIIGQIVYLF